MEPNSYEELMWRARNDHPSRDQYKEIFAEQGYVCEGLHLSGVPATRERPPMPELRAKHPIRHCEECWRKLPATQADVTRRTV